MKNLTKKTELLISIFVISTSIILSAVLVNRFLFNDSETVSANSHKQTIKSDIKWVEHTKTIVIALQTTCHFCNESSPFYKRLIENVRNKDIKIIAIFPNNIEESRLHLDKLGLNDLEVKQSSLDDFQVNGTPTLILFNNKGEVIDSWVGKLPPEKETEVLNKVSF